LNITLNGYQKLDTKANRVYQILPQTQIDPIHEVYRTKTTPGSNMHADLIGEAEGSESPTDSHVAIAWWMLNTKGRHVEDRNRERSELSPMSIKYDVIE